MPANYLIVYFLSPGKSFSLLSASEPFKQNSIFLLSDIYRAPLLHPSFFSFLSSLSYCDFPLKNTTTYQHYHLSLPTSKPLGPFWFPPSVIIDMSLTQTPPFNTLVTITQRNTATSQFRPNFMKSPIFSKTYFSRSRFHWTNPFLAPSFFHFAAVC